jgi:hypothetical protein
MTTSENDKSVMHITITEQEYQALMQIKREKEPLKQTIRLARVTGLLIGAKSILDITDDFDKQGLIKIIDEVLELLK